MSDSTIAMGNIQRVIAVNMETKTPAEYFDADGNFVDENGFFIRAETAGLIRYCPIGNKTDGESITKQFDASYIFIDPEVCRKIITAPVTSPVTAASTIYVGYGV